MVDMVEGGTGILILRPAANGGIRRGGRPAGRHNIAPDDHGMWVGVGVGVGVEVGAGVGVGVGVGAGFGLVSTRSTDDQNPYFHSACRSTSSAILYYSASSHSSLSICFSSYASSSHIFSISSSSTK